MTLFINVKKLHPEAIIPQYQTEGAAGMDLCALEPISIMPGRRALVRTGLAFAIPEGFEGQIRPRSGSALRHGLTVLNSPGTVDSDYRGEIRVLLINVGQDPVAIKQGDRIAQIVFCPVAKAVLCPVDQLPDTKRGAGGFGSTDG